MKKMRMALMATATLLMAACSQDELVNSTASQESADNVMHFSVSHKNMTRANAALQDTHKEFGVWAVKTVDTDVQDVMDRYLVGYYNPDGTAGDKGYYGANASTIGDAPSAQNGYSMWFYEGLGNEEYTNIPAGFITSSPAYYGKQYLKYWDKASDQTEFFAVVPYSLITSTSGSHASYLNKKITVTELQAGFGSTNECLLAYKSVANGAYGNDVPLVFKRANGKVNLKFYETIEGYDVHINWVKETMTNLVGESSYEFGTDEVVKVNGTPTYGALAEGENFGVVNQTTDLTNTTKHGTTVKRIGDIRNNASPCVNTYFCLPAGGDTENSDMVVEVNYTLYSHDTNETITLTNSVKVQSDYTQWVANTHYTYYFRITRDAEGLTPIVFDAIEVADYTDAELNQHDWIITSETNPTACIKHTLPATLTKDVATQFTVTNYQVAEVSGNVYAEITFNAGSALGTGDLTLNYYESDPGKTLGWKPVGKDATNTKYVFGDTTAGFPLADEVPLKLEVTATNTGAIDATITIWKAGKPQTAENKVSSVHVTAIVE